MSKPTILKVLFLVLGLVAAMFFRHKLSDGKPGELAGILFGESAKENKFYWCVDHVVDMVWVSDQINPMLKELSHAELRENYCELKSEPFSGVDLAQVQWAPLAESTGPTGLKSFLEWNAELKLFRSSGLPFKSSKFSQELQIQQ